MFSLGQLIASLQSVAPKQGVRHRKYWTANGLVGKTPKFGSIEMLSGVSSANQKIISEARSIIFRKLLAFEKKFPQRQGMIHADLHFGNVLSLQQGLGAIDFDDCGLGFHAYDLVIPLISAEHILAAKRKKELVNFREALLSGYASKANWDKHDEQLFPHLINARKLTMLGWLNSRSENPRLKKRLSGAVKQAVATMKKSYDL